MAERRTSRRILGAFGLLVAAGLFAWALREPAQPAEPPVPEVVRAAQVAEAIEPAPPATRAPAAPKAAPRVDAGPGAQAKREPPRTAPRPPEPERTVWEQLASPFIELGNRYVTARSLAHNAAEADAYVDRLCEEAGKLREHPVFPDSPQAPSRDAAEFMAPLIDYEAPLDKPPGRLHLPDALRDRLRSYGPQWPTRITEQDLAGMDFAWLAALGAFDHWSLYSAGPLRGQPADFFRGAIPNYIGLQQWAKLRLVLGLRSGDAPLASAEVRHLADLVRSQGLLISEMVALSIYRIDARARAAAAAAGQDVSAWPEVEPEQFDRYQRMAFAGLYFAWPGVEPETVRKASGCLAAPCVDLLEAAGANRAVGHFSGANNLELTLQLASERGCDPELVARVRASREYTGTEARALSELETARQIPDLFQPTPEKPAAPQAH